ncbi:saccharopine dehydrogenase family protein [Flavihumibacter stibioxidans]|uniref:Saccharopine dehydrogenase NADP binding domain-containing protein n=1 Tax=Flavihumibacter stibioxidans TaxID=1834163 RepID=A0ABR7MCL6_9BACT|nr:saccharopine dehydrogenase NADP-binding domain-containing protein [Flavihumibacter stibioxidans]MBC6492783.1 hypothetical protein [Flavihumibacter stibioxidans]
MSGTLLLYGANGYTGKLILELSVQQRIKPILAGRNAIAIRSLAESYSLPYRIGGLEDQATMDVLLKDVDVVIHAAGPFSITARPMMEACIRNKVHYLDITGEIGVFEMAAQLGKEARAAGIMLMPGVGFDVVPTDCMAQHLKTLMPDATHLALAFANIGGAISHGTATTMAQSLGEGGAIRSKGKIIRSPLGAYHRWVDFGKGKRFVMSIPWGDVATAFHTTGIPNIIAYTAIKPGIHRLLKLQGLLNPVLKTRWARKMVQNYINRQPAGPSTEMLNRSSSMVWGEVSNPKGETISARMSCMNGYSLTAHSSLLIAKKVLAEQFKPGYQTPAGCYGAQLIGEIPGSSEINTVSKSP